MALRTPRRFHRRCLFVPLLLAIAATGGFASHARAIDGQWSFLHGPLDAPASLYHSSLYDAAHRRMLSFGYMSGAVYQMSLDGPPEWHLLACDGVAPGSWGEGSAVLDAGHGRVLWFGGKCDASYPCAEPVVHVLDLSGTPTWSTLAVSGTPPPARFGHVAIYDATHDRMIVYGGENLARVWIGDVWALSLSGTPTWTEITPAGPGPGERIEMAAIYDPVRERMLVHGGYRFVSDPTQPTGGITTVYGDVWALSLDGTPAWTPLATAGPTPPARFYQSAAYDPGADRMLMCNGFTGWVPGGVALSDAWSLSLSGTPTWSQIPAGGASTTTFGQTAIFEPDANRLIVQGGYSVQGRVAELSLGTSLWSNLTPPEPGLYPGRVGASRTFYDAVRHRLLLFPTSGALATIWSWSQGSGWLAITTSGTPFIYYDGFGMAYDSARDRLIFLGGGDRAYRGDPLGSVSALSLAGTPTWTPLAVSGTLPPGRSNPCAGYDPLRDRVVMFGGSYTGSPSGWGSTWGDTWTLSMTSLTWTSIPAAPAAPLRRTRTSLVYDAARDAMVLFAGGDLEDYGTAPVFDAWMLPLSAASPVWTPLGPAAPVAWDGSPGSFSGVVDLAHDRVLAPSLSDHATWALPMSAPASWTRLDIGGEAPPPRFQESLAIDTDLARVLMLGGQDGLARGDLWALSLDAPTAAEVSLVSADAQPDRVAISWSVAGGASSLSVERSLAGSSEWRRLGQVFPDGTGRVSFVDRDVVSGTTYDYRLAISDGGTQRFGGETTIAVPVVHPEATFALANAGANPTTRGLAVTISLPDAAAARLEVHDVAGRRVLAREVGGLGAGSHTVALDESRLLSPGLYLVRLVRGTEFRSARVAVVR